MLHGFGEVKTHFMMKMEQLVLILEFTLDKWMFSIAAIHT